MIKQFFKKVLIIYLVVIACVFTPTYKAYAVSAVGWSFSSFDVAKSLVTAMKNGATATAAVAKSPISQKIAKGIVGGVIAGTALPLAISQLSGFALNAIDWVLDPANNAVKWKPKDGGYYLVDSYIGQTPKDACQKWLSAHKADFGNATVVASESGSCFLYGGLYEYNGHMGNTWKFVKDTNEYRKIPIPTVAVQCLLIYRIKISSFIYFLYCLSLLRQLT
jgi:hypothetical protein